MGTYYSNALAHYGIGGQRWGVRRYQNKDGTLTEEGKRRYYKDSKRQEKSLKRDMKKLKKLEDKTNVKLQAAKYERHMRKTILPAALMVVALGPKRYMNKTVQRRANILANPALVTKDLKSFASSAVFAAGIVSAIPFAVHAIKAYNANKLVTSIGHDKAVRKYNDQISYMQNKYANTSVSEIVNTMNKKEFKNKHEKD